MSNLVESGKSRQIGHHPLHSVLVEGWLIRRCICGMTLMLSPHSGTLWWLLARSAPRQITSLTDLYAALATECRYYRGADPHPQQVDLAAHIRVKDQLAAATTRIKALEADLQRRLEVSPVPTTPRFAKVEHK